MYVKVCGITHIDDAFAAIAAGVDAIGFNFVESSRRYLPPDDARAILNHVRGKVLCVAVVANLTRGAVEQLLSKLPLDRVQLHGDEPAREVEALLPRAFKALAVGDVADVERARGMPGHPLLVDAKVQGQLGGTGQCVDWPLVAPLARERQIILAGGLDPGNVERAVQVVQPWGVDVASGVERPGDCRRKDFERMKRFVETARRSSRPLRSLEP